VEHSRRPLYDIAVFEFFLRHHGTPENIQVARAIVEGNTKVVEDCVKKGSFSKTRLQEIRSDDVLQCHYAQMADALKTGDTKEFDRLYNRINDTPDTICGWLVFYNQQMEMDLSADLIKRSRLYYHYLDFQAEN
jgi:hypothetical protein